MEGIAFLVGMMTAIEGVAESQMTPEQLAEHRAKREAEHAKFKEEHPYAGIGAILMIAAYILLPALAAALFFACLLFR